LRWLQCDYADRLPGNRRDSIDESPGDTSGFAALIQYPLWLGKRRLDACGNRPPGDAAGVQQQSAGRAQCRLESEVRDLREGLLAVEERARYELGMVS
jgi:hypothetical protein